MTKLIHNKMVRAAVAIVMAVLLVVSLIPVFQPAYGSNPKETVPANATFENISDVLSDDMSTSEDAEGSEYGEAFQADEETEGIEGSDGTSPDGSVTIPDDPSAPGETTEGSNPSSPEGSGDVPGFDGSDGSEDPAATPEEGEDEWSPTPDEWVESDDTQGPDGLPEEDADYTDGPSEEESEESVEGETSAEGEEDEGTRLSGTVVNQNDIVIKGDQTETANLEFRNNDTYNITIDGTLIGTIYITGGATVNINGSGLINGNGAPTVIHVEGGNSTLNINPDEGCLEITGGNGGTQLNDHKNFPDYVSGGGILVQRKGVKSDGTGGTGATLNIYNGWIHHNFAGSGAGIHIDRDCSFYMKYAEITNNETKPGTYIDYKDGKKPKTAPAHEAGGIYVAGSSTNSPAYTSNEHAYIEGGIISNNHTSTTIDWGGGGIFVESKGVLRIGTASITGNVADGLGGGVSGCPHALIGMGDITEGAAIWGNTAKKLRKPFNSFLSVSQVQNGHRYGDMYAYGLYESDFKDGELVKDSKGKILRRSGISSDDGLGDYVGKPFSKDQFTADYAHDYYCTKVSAIMGPNVGMSLPNNEVWKGYTANESGGKSFTIKKGEVQAFSVGAVGLTSLLPSDYTPGDRALIIEGNTSTTHGGGIGCNGKLIMGTLPSGESYGTISLTFNKQLVSSLGEVLNFGDYTFDFELTCQTTGDVYTATTDATGAFTFNLKGKPYLEGMENGQQKTLTFELREVSNRSYPDISFDPNGYEVVLTFTASVQEAGIVGAANVTSYAFMSPAITVNGGDSSDFVVTNTLQLWGAWTPYAKKFFHGGQGAPGAYTFELVEIEDPQGSLVDTAPKEGGEVREAVNDDFSEADGSAWVMFDSMFYSEPGEHWYRIRETNGNDPVVYVVKVVVAGDNEGLPEVSTVLVPEVTDVYYANSLESDTLTKLEGNLAEIEFHNNGGDGFNYFISGYAVNAKTNAPLTQKCLVDPKIIKELEGRTLTPGEFSFQLIEVADYADTTGVVISETSNDAYGMVDFDAAANKADPGWEPSCLLFTQPGTYKYRVIENPSQLADPSIDYSDQVITFTVVVELDPETGILAASDMYYGYLNEAGENVRYKEQYQGWESQGETWVPSADDYFRFDTQWHPTMTNRVKPMDLAVRKTSALTGEALEGATYALYLVNYGDEADIHLGSSTSDADGWIYFEDVSLKAGNLYYFLEEGAPEGHTVSKFRSKYFYLTPDASAVNGFVLNYTEDRLALEEGVEDETGGSQAGGELLVTFAAAASADQADGADEGDGADGADGGVSDGASDDADGTGNGAESDGADTEPSAPSKPTTGKDGALLYTYEADGGVQDEATYLEFNKLDTKNHEWVEGAKLSVVEKETGRVINSWVSGSAPEVLQQVLNVGVVYVLREDEAPEGYEKADDVEFRIGSFGEVEILSGASNGNAELSGSTLTLYDTRIPIEEVVIEEREKVREVPENKYLSETIKLDGSKQEVTQDARQVPQQTQLAQTDDMWLIIATCLLGASAALLLLALFVSRRIRKNANK